MASSQVRSVILASKQTLIYLVTGSIYAGVTSTSEAPSSNTGYKWSFVNRQSQSEQRDLEAARRSVGQATYKEPSTSSAGADHSRRSRVAGPTLPSAADWTDHIEETSASARRDAQLSRKRERQEDKDRVEDLAGPREVGREGMLEKKRLKRESDRQMRDKDDAGLEVSEDVLLGGGDSFKAR